MFINYWNSIDRECNGAITSNKKSFKKPAIMDSDVGSYKQSQSPATNGKMS